MVTEMTAFEAKTANSIPSSSDLIKDRIAFLDSIVQSGRVDDILALCKEAVRRVGSFGVTVPLPRTLTDDEYAAVSRALSKSGWWVRYTWLGLITGNRKLVISEPDEDE